MEYEGNPKHKEPWQRGRQGSPCPQDVDPNALLDESEQAGDKRYATDGERVFCAQEHGSDLWHGYPVGWREIPESLRRQWLSEGKVKRASIRKHWDG